MNVLLTGASSFTGYWFARALHAAGCRVVAPLRGGVEGEDRLRAERVRRLAGCAEVVADCAFGSPAFLDLVASRDFDVLCHHAAEVANYRSADFDVAAALAANTRNLRPALTRLVARGLKAVVATGSVFEPDEGSGPHPRRAFSPYGLSKALTFETLRYWGEVCAVPVSKFVVANPFGPFEQPRFVAYVVRRWAEGQPAEVRTPAYLRDNIHVDLLAAHYAHFVVTAGAGGPARRFGPCGYLETQGAFAGRLARELAPRLRLAGEVALLRQSEFEEPLARLNLDVVEPPAGWNEAAAWDALAQFYAPPVPAGGAN